MAEVQLADTFLAQAKSLDGPPPIWANSAWGGEYAASWNILDSSGVPAASLRFTAKKTDTSLVAINLIWRSKPLWRVEIEPPITRHSNPPDAWSLGLPPFVQGTHFHPWSANRGHILAQDQQWDLPYRQQGQIAIRRLGQALLWLAGEIKLTIDPGQHGFEGPTRADLFG